MLIQKSRKMRLARKRSFASRIARVHKISYYYLCPKFNARHEKNVIAYPDGTKTTWHEGRRPAQYCKVSTSHPPEALAN